LPEVAVTLVTGGPTCKFFARLEAHFGQRQRSASGKDRPVLSWHLATDICRKVASPCRTVKGVVLLRYFCQSKTMASPSSLGRPRQ
jgi:hypothetical protein